MATTTADHLPIIHRNGTAKDDLVKAIVDALSLVRDAKDKLRLTAPDGRDYYLEPGRISRANEVFNRRMKALHDLASELENDAIEIDQMD